MKKINLFNRYRRTGDFANAKKAISEVYEITYTKSKITRYQQVINTVRISYMTMCYLYGGFQEVIHEGNMLLKYQYEVNNLERIHYAYFYLAFAYYQTGIYDEAMAMFEKGIYYVMIEDKPMDVYYISGQDVFNELLNDSRINRAITDRFKEKYRKSILR